MYGDLSRGAVHKWKQLGLQLDLELYELDAISADYKDDPEENMSKVFELWKQQSLKQTWNDLIEAINRTRLNKQLYENLKTKHESGTCTTLKSYCILKILSYYGTRVLDIFCKIC